MDETDRQILAVLQADGREAFSQIADRKGVSPWMIRQGYNRLIGMGFLKVVAITNPIQSGLETMAMIGIRTDGNRMLQVAA